MMNQSDIFKKIGVILNELQEQYEFLAQNPELLNELELFLANASFLSDHVEIVRKLNASKKLKELPLETKVSAMEAEQIPAKPVVVEKQPVVDDLPEPKDYSFFDKPADLVAYVTEEPASTAPTFEFILNDRPESDRFDFEEEKPVEEIFDRPLSKEEAEIIASKQRILTGRYEELFPALPKTELLPDPIPEKEIPKPSVELVEDRIERKVVQPVSISAPPQAEPVFVPEPTFTAEPAPVAPPVPVAAVTSTQQTATPVEPAAASPRPTLNDLLAGKQNNTSKAKEENTKAPIADLKGAITLNEKLLYIKDLFNGYNLAYSEAIDLINKMPDLKTADAFLKNSYAEKNNWQSKENTVDQFYSLLKRRFPEEA